MRDAQTSIKQDIHTNETIDQRKQRLKQFVEQRDALIIHYRKLASLLGARAEFDSDGLPVMESVDKAFESIEPGIVNRMRMQHHKFLENREIM